MNAPATLPAATTTSTLQPIPYRTESPVTAGKALSVFAMTMVLLAIVGGLLLWARKRGWLQRWSGANASGATSGRNTPRVLGQARLGTASHAYVVEVDGSRFMIVESSRQISLHALSDANAGPGDRV